MLNFVIEKVKEMNKEIRISFLSECSIRKV